MCYAIEDDQCFFELTVPAISISPFWCLPRPCSPTPNAILPNRCLLSAHHLNLRSSSARKECFNTQQSTVQVCTNDNAAPLTTDSRTNPSSPSIARHTTRGPQVRRSTSRVKRRHASREATRRREREVWRGAGSSSTGGRERQATRRGERQAARAAAARGRDRHGRQVRRAAGAWRREWREGLVGTRADGRREGEAASWRRTGRATADAWQSREPGRRDASGEGRREGHAGRGEGSAAGLVLGQHGVVVGLALGGVGGGDGVDD